MIKTDVLRWPSIVSPFVLDSVKMSLFGLLTRSAREAIAYYKTSEGRVGRSVLNVWADAATLSMLLQSAAIM